MSEITPPPIDNGIKRNYLKAVACFFVGHNVAVPGNPTSLYYYCHRCWKKGVAVDVLMLRKSRCRYDFKPGWWCSRAWRHEGACALRPKWWNLLHGWDYWSRGGR